MTYSKIAVTCEMTMLHVIGDVDCDKSVCVVVSGHEASVVTLLHRLVTQHIPAWETGGRRLICGDVQSGETVTDVCQTDLYNTKSFHVYNTVQ